MRNVRLAAVGIYALLTGVIAIASTADIVGTVPGVGTPLRLRKNAVTPQHLDLTWGDSCGPEQNDFAVYEGTIGTWYGHTQKLCSTSGALAVSDVTPSPGNRYYLVVALSPTSEGGYGTDSEGAQIPVGVPPCRATQSTDACVWQRVFVSSDLYSANLGGLSGADAKCQSLADTAQLGGFWNAWLSDSSTNAATRIFHSSLSYRRIDGVLIAVNANGFFSTTHVNAIDRDEYGSLVSNAEVWTGSHGTGIGSGGCANWTSSDPGGAFPVVGLSSRTDSAWSNVYLQLCDRVGRLYCVED